MQNREGLLLAILLLTGCLTSCHGHKRLLQTLRKLHQVTNSMRQYMYCHTP